MGGSRELGGYARERSLIKSTASHSPFSRASTVGLPSRSARFITSSSSTSRGRQAENAQKYPLRLHQPTMSQQSTSCWIRRCNRQYIFLPQFYSRQPLLSARWKIPLSNSFASSICNRREFSLFTASAAAGPELRGQMIAPILSRKGTNESGAFPKEKGSQWTHSIPSRTERVCFSPNASVVCVIWCQKRWHGSAHLLKCFIILTLQKQGPLMTKRGWCVRQALFFARRHSLACVIGVHLPMSNALGVCNHASRHRSCWRRSHSAL